MVIVLLRLFPFWQKIRETDDSTKEISRDDLTKYFFGESKFFILLDCEE